MHGATVTVVIAAVKGTDDTVAIAAVLTQFEPAESRFRMVVPGQQPCLEDKHMASECKRLSINLVVAIDLGCVVAVGQLEPAESLL